MDLRIILESRRSMKVCKLFVKKKKKKRHRKLDKLKININMHGSVQVFKQICAKKSKKSCIQLQLSVISFNLLASQHKCPIFFWHELNNFWLQLALIVTLTSSTAVRRHQQPKYLYCMLPRPLLRPDFTVTVKHIKDDLFSYVPNVVVFQLTGTLT